MSTSATVAFVPLRTDLANLPNDLSGMLFNSNTPVQNIVVELSFQQGLRSDSKVYMGWSGMTAAKPGTIEVDPTFAQNSRLPFNAKVSIKVHVNAPLAHTVHLEPATTADWEIVETHVAYIESWMINQVRAVSTSHPITLYPSSTAIACLQVTKIEPTPPGAFAKLSPDSEVIVAPKVKKTAVKPGSEKPLKKPSNKRPIEAVVVRSVAAPFGYQGSPIEIETPQPGTRELILYADLPTMHSNDLVSVSVVRPTGIIESGAKPEPKTEGKPDEDLQPAKTVNARLVQVSTATPTLSYGLSSALRIVASVGQLIRIAAPTGTEDSGPAILHKYTTTSAPSSLKLSGSSEKSQQIPPALQSELALKLVSNGLVVPPSRDLPFGGIIETAFDYGIADKISFGPDIVIAESHVQPKLSEIDAPPKREVVGRDDILSKVVESCVGGNGTLIYGSRGSGKSVILSQVERELKRRLITSLVFNSGMHADKPVPFVRDALKRLFLEAAWYSPSIVILDDLESLIPAEQEHGDSSRAQQLAEIFRSLAKAATASRPIAILASSQSKEALHSSLISSHLFDELVHIPSPDKRVRETILVEALSNLGMVPAPDVDILDIVSDTEGYQPGDLWVLAERVSAMIALREVDNILDSVSFDPRDDIANDAAPKLNGTSGSAERNGSSATIADKSQDTEVVPLDVFKAATADYTPASLRGVKLEKPPVKWDEIGGLVDVKRTILETLEWPTKYAPIFANCPLRLRSGLLLYGYPGCGKTLLASAIAAKTGLNFISVKGPEILNKYIGASEQSVRDLFDRAQAAKPCVLFFDEFDSIAPKRGHDSTGVTDRVVNQMLTQMDGAEGLDGVYVLAATSRPDLIDSALLRPGRLDKSLLCDMPSYEDRLEILSAAKEKMTLDLDVDLVDIARKTAGWSGADLQAIMTNAYLNAIHSVVDLAPLETVKGPTDEPDMFIIQGAEKVDPQDIKKYVSAGSPGENGESAKQLPSTAPVVVSYKHLQKSLDETKPSISTKELAKLRGIYQQFVSDRDGQMPPGTSSNDIGGRVTLS